MEFRSVQKYLVMSPRKLRLVARLAKNLTPMEAIEQLPFSNKRAAGPIVKTIRTAVANAEQKGISPDQLEFSEIQINMGPKLKRWRAGARGIVKPYAKSMSHIRVVLKTREDEKREPKDKKVKKVKKTKRGGNPPSRKPALSADRAAAR